MDLIRRLSFSDKLELLQGYYLEDDLAQQILNLWSTFRPDNQIIQDLYVAQATAKQDEKWSEEYIKENLNLFGQQLGVQGITRVFRILHLLALSDLPEEVRKKDLELFMANPKPGSLSELEFKELLYINKEWAPQFRQICYEVDLAPLIRFLIDNNIDPQLTIADLERLPISRQFESWIREENNPLNYDFFDTVEKSRHYSLMPWHVDQVRNIFLKHIKSTLSIVDLTSHIGVDDVNFKYLYPNAKLVAIEWDYNTWLKLSANLLRYAILQYTNPTLDQIGLAYNADSTQSLNSPIITESETIYLDPVWDDIDYKGSQKVRLSIGNLDVMEIIQTLKSSPYIKNIVLKTPLNFLESDLANYKVAKEIVKTSGGKDSYLLFFIS